MKGRGNSHT